MSFPRSGLAAYPGQMQINDKKIDCWILEQLSKGPMVPDKLFETFRQEVGVACGENTFRRRLKGLIDIAKYATGTLPSGPCEITPEGRIALETCKKL